MDKKNGWVKSVFIQLGLVVLSSLLFTISFPNPIFKNGLAFFAWFAYIPILLVIQKNNIKSCIAYGAIYGCITYALFNFWLITFHPLAGAVVYTIYLIYMAILFPILKLAEILFKKRAYIVQWTIWLAYEYLRTTGFLGYSYGITGYSQWRFIPLIQIASITGVWGVNALVTFPSFWLANVLRYPLSATRSFLIKEKIPVIIWAAALAGALTFGFSTNKDFSSCPQVKIALIQHNTDPWESSKAPTSWQKREVYQKDLAILMRLSDEAATSEPDLIVWPETAFVPRIYWHYTYRDDQDSWVVVRELLEYLSVQEIPFLIGNDDARMDRAINPDERQKHRVDYNAALLFENGEITEIYRKMHLVPFTEHFPYKKRLPSIHKALEQRADTNFWEKGKEETVFRIDNLRTTGSTARDVGEFSFSTPICFEDTFGYLSRNFVLRGADVLINLTNDAWAKSLSAQNQHLAISVFRAVENFRPMVRSTVSGQTCAIDPQGRIAAEATPFKETWLFSAVPIVKPRTFYNLYGDYLGIIQCFAAFTLLILGALWYTIRKRKKG